MYSDTTAFRMAALRGSSSSSDLSTRPEAASDGEGLGAGRAGRAVRFGTMGVLALDCSECYLGVIAQGLEPALVTARWRWLPDRAPPAPGRAAGAGGDAPELP